MRNVKRSPVFSFEFVCCDFCLLDSVEAKRQIFQDEYQFELRKPNV